MPSPADAAGRGRTRASSVRRWDATRRGPAARARRSCGSSLLLTVVVRVVLAVEVALEGVEMPGPESPVGFEPLVEPLERRGFDPVDAALRVDPARDEPRLAQHLQVLGHRRLADVERVDEVAHAALRRAELVEDQPPGRLCKHRERVRGHRSIFLGTYMPVKAYTTRTQRATSSGGARAARYPAP